MIYFILFILALNVLWFSMGFRYFCFQSESATKLLLKKEYRIEPYFSIIAHAIKFVGAFNFAFAILSIICLIRFHYPELDTPSNIGLFFVFFIAHLGQFWVNLPVALKEKRKEQHLWPVLKGSMHFIFKTDLFLAICNLIISVYLFI